MKSQVIFKQKFEIDSGDFINAGDASCQISNLLKEIGICNRLHFSPKKR